MPPTRLGALAFMLEWHFTHTRIDRPSRDALCGRTSGSTLAIGTAPEALGRPASRSSANSTSKPTIDSAAANLAFVDSDKSPCVRRSSSRSRSAARASSVAGSVSREVGPASINVPSPRCSAPNQARGAAGQGPPGRLRLVLMPRVTRMARGLASA